MSPMNCYTNAQIIKWIQTLSTELKKNQIIMIIQETGKNLNPIAMHKRPLSILGIHQNLTVLDISDETDEPTITYEKIIDGFVKYLLDSEKDLPFMIYDFLTREVYCIKNISANDDGLPVLLIDEAAKEVKEIIKKDLN